MCYDIISTERFENDMQYYVKKKKYKHIIDDVEKVVNSLEQGELLGDVIPDLAINCNEHTVKVRVANTDTKVGKSNGYRIIYYVVKDDKEIFLLTIYYKKEDNRIPTNKEIASLVKEYCL